MRWAPQSDANRPCAGIGPLKPCVAGIYPACPESGFFAGLLISLLDQQHDSEHLVLGLVLSSALLAGQQSGCTQASDAKSMFSREYVACSECARFFTPPVQNVPGFVVAGIIANQAQSEMNPCLWGTHGLDHRHEASSSGKGVADDCRAYGINCLSIL